MSSNAFARLALGCSTVLTLALSACDGVSTAPAAPVARVDVTGTPADNVLLVGSTVPLAAVARDAAGSPLSRTIAWSSSDGDVARVSPSGVVTGVSPGVAVVSAEAGGATGVVAIDVRVSVPVPTAGAPTISTPLGDALQLTIPPGATTLPALTVGRAVILTNDVRLLTATAFVVGPSGVTFGAPVGAALRVNLGPVPAARRAGVRLYRVTAESGAEVVAGGGVDVASGVLSSALVRGGVYVAAVPGEVAQAAATEGNTRRVPVETAVPGVGIIARDALGNPVPGASVVFAVEGGNGRIVGDSTAVTGNDGVAALRGQWIAGPGIGRSVLRARVVGVPVSVLFEATTFAPAAAVVIRSAPTTGRSGLRFSEPFTVELVDAAGRRAEVNADVTLRLLGSNGTLRGTLTSLAVLGGVIFQGQQIDGPGTFRVIASAAGLAPDTSANIVITQEAASLALVTAPGGAVSGLPFTSQPVVELRDAAALRVIGGTAPVTASALGLGTLFGTRTVAAIDGRATFTSLGIDGIGTGSLVFSAFGATNLSSELTVVPPPPGVRLRVGVAPVRDVTPGEVFGVPIRVDLSNRGTANVRTVDVTVTWDPARFNLFGEVPGSWRDSTNAEAAITVDLSQSAQGRVRVTGASPGATTASFDLVLLQLETRAASLVVETVVGATVAVARDAAGNDLVLRVLALTAQVLGQ